MLKLRTNSNTWYVFEMTTFFSLHLNHHLCTVLLGRLWRASYPSARLRWTTCRNLFHQPNIEGMLTKKPWRKLQGESKEPLHLNLMFFVWRPLYRWLTAHILFLSLYLSHTHCYNYTYFYLAYACVPILASVTICSQFTLFMFSFIIFPCEVKAQLQPQHGI